MARHCLDLVDGLFYSLNGRLGAPAESVATESSLKCPAVALGRGHDQNITFTQVRSRHTMERATDLRKDLPVEAVTASTLNKQFISEIILHLCSTPPNLVNLAKRGKYGYCRRSAKGRRAAE